jgi:prepilin peptidase CpaA
MHITAVSALWFLPFVVPICFFVIFNDLREMKITNNTVLLLGAVFLAVGLVALPFDQYLWRLAQMAIVLAIGFVLNAAGTMGGGDAKFLAAAAPFVHQSDAVLVGQIFAACLLAAFVTQRFAKYSGLRRLAPDWINWDRGRLFPMGMALGGTLAMYLGLGAYFGV